MQIKERSTKEKNEKKKKNLEQNISTEETKKEQV